jgi:hypothetical protein
LIFDFESPLFILLKSGLNFVFFLFIFLCFKCCGGYKVIF